MHARSVLRHEAQLENIREMGTREFEEMTPEGYGIPRADNASRILPRLFGMRATVFKLPEAPHPSRPRGCLQEVA